MKIIIKDVAPGEEETVVFSLNNITSKVSRAINILKSPEDLTLTVFEEKKAMLLPVTEIFYIESVDSKTFVYAQDALYSSKYRLYELEEQLEGGEFLKASKQMLINLRKVKSVSPYGGGRFEAVFTNEEKVIISRQYVAELKARFGL